MADAMKLVLVEPDAGLMSVIAAMVRRIAVPVSLVPEEVYFDNGHARQIYKAITDAAAAYPLASTQRPEREAIMQIIDANKYEAWTVDRAGQMADAILASPPAREEAPAEGAGDELDLYDDKVQAGIAWTLRQVGEALGLTTWTQGDGSESVEGDVGAEIYTILADAGLRDPETNEMAALRNRTSEPEAGAVAWTCSASLDFVSGGPFRASSMWSYEDPAHPVPLYLHPAPATADKLRVAVEALRKARAALHEHYVEWDGEPEDAVPLQLARADCDQALAALNAEVK